MQTMAFLENHFGFFISVIFAISDEPQGIIQVPSWVESPSRKSNCTKSPAW